MERAGNDGESERTSRRDSEEGKRRYRSRSRSRERDRSYYSRRRERSREKDRRSGRSRSRDRDRDSSRRRERSQSRERDRNTSRYLDRSRSQERNRERDEKQSSRSKYDDRRHDQEERHRNRRSRDGYRGSPEERDHGKGEEPSPVLMLRNLKEEVRKEDISRAIGVDMSYVKDIRLVQRSWKEQGNQGFAFLEFYQPQDASRWLEKHKENFKVLGSSVDIDFSRHRHIGEKKSMNEDKDWSCFKCGTLNFARRRVCMTCDCPRGESESLHADVREGRLTNTSEERRFDSDREDKNPPSNVLILRGLDALSDENSVRSAIGKLISLPLKDVRLIRDKATNTSRGFCFVELNSIDEAKQLLEVIQSQYPAFFVDGRRLIVNFARQMNASGGKSVSSSVASAAIAQAQWSMQTLALMKSGVVQSQTVKQPQVHQTSIQQANQQGGSQVQATDHLGQTNATSREGVPNSSSECTACIVGLGGQLPSTYSYDPTSGFYYDSATGLYYDPKTQYHYNSQTGLYCYYDSQKQAYVSVDQHGNAMTSTSSTTTPSTVTTTADTSSSTSKGKKNIVTSSSTSTAKKIAKDMERWAKSVNAAKVVQQQQLQAVVKSEVQVAALAPVLMPTDIHSISQDVHDVSPRSGIALTAALMESDDDKPSLAAHAADVEEPVTSRLPVLTGMDVHPAHTDWNQLACLLCKRKFPSREVLIKHQQFSDLHKQNLEKEKVQLEQLAEVKYRDRAKERRDKYGSPAIVPGWKKRLEREIASGPDREHPTPYEQPTVEGLKDDNIGNKMLQAMGWSEGQGLGKSNQGIVEPIKAEQRQVGAGLGAPGSKFLYSSAGTYRETLKQLTKARYEGAFS